MFKRKLRFFLHRWHRRLGLAAAVIVLMVSFTGILLNHTGGLALAKQYPQSGFWLWPYPQEQHSGIQLNDHLLYQTSQQVFLNGQPLLNCAPPLINAVIIDQQLWVLCASQLLFLQNGQLIESIETVLLGNSISNIGESNGLLLIKNLNTWHGFDDLTMQLGKPTNAPSVLNKVAPLENIQTNNHTITWQKVILDIHSGRFFGSLGIYIVDAAAIILMLLALSGFWIWFSRQKH